MSYINTNFEIKEDELRSFRKEGYICGIFCSKAYRIYFPGFKKIDISRDVTFDEDLAYIKSRKRPVEEPEEQKHTEFIIQPLMKKFKKKIKN